MSIDIVLMLDCASNYGVFAVGAYRVEMHGSEGPARCDCDSFKFAPHDNKTCKHIRYLWEGGACLYNPQWKEGQATPPLRPIEYTSVLHNELCPSCDGPTVAVRRAV